MLNRKCLLARANSDANRCLLPSGEGVRRRVQRLCVAVARQLPPRKRRSGDSRAGPEPCGSGYDKSFEARHAVPSLEMSDFPYPSPSSAAAMEIMRGNRSRDIKPEVEIRSLLHRRGLRFRKAFR